MHIRVQSTVHFIDCTTNCHDQCDYFATLRMSIWGKPDLYNADIDTATVGDIARFIEKISQISIEYLALTGTTGMADGPALWFKPTGR